METGHCPVCLGISSGLPAVLVLTETRGLQCSPCLAPTACSTVSFRASQGLWVGRKVGAGFYRGGIGWTGKLAGWERTSAGLRPNLASAFSLSSHSPVSPGPRKPGDNHAG